MTEATAPVKVLTYFVETCRHQAIGTVKIRAKANTDEPYDWENRSRAQRAMRRRFGKSKTCVFCGSPRLDLHPEPLEVRYACSADYTREESAKEHARRAPVGLRNPNAAVYQVLTCTGDLIGFVSVLKKLPRFERERQAEKTMYRRFGKPRRCGQCGDTSHDLRQVSGPGMGR
jgi:hypothetical protein